jgi:hypothetical protein
MARYAAVFLIMMSSLLLELPLNVTFGASWDELLTVTALYVLIAVPFTLSGIFICLALLHAEDGVGVLAYAVCALVVPLAFPRGDASLPIRATT